MNHGHNMKLSFIAALIVPLALGLACEDEAGPIEVPPPPERFENLTEREHVLNNIEVSYNKRRIDTYDELLDDGFEFFLSAGDVRGGLPPSWGRAEELQYNVSLFDPNYSGEHRCKRIQMDLLFESGVQWIEVVPGASPGEVWYMATVAYEFTFEMEPDDTFVSAEGSAAQFTVRNTGTVDEPRWKLVECRDLGGGLRGARRVASVEQPSWGGVKALYR
jgi:hypothetical protein